MGWCPHIRLPPRASLDYLPLRNLVQVYVTVYADGPTRVLRFSDEKNVSSLEQQHVILDLAARLKQVGRQAGQRHPLGALSLFGMVCARAALGCISGIATWGWLNGGRRCGLCFS